MRGYYRVPLALASLCLFFLFLSVILPSVVDANFDPYRVLDIRRGASAAEVKKAYKKQAKLWHPDKSADPSAQSRFQQISEAYDVLSDPVKKADFDAHGVIRSKQQREQEEARNAYFAQQRAYQQQYANAHYGHGWGMDPAYARRHDAYYKESDDPGSPSVRLTSANWDHYISSVNTQRFTNQGWVIYVHSHNCEPCQALSPSFAFMARSLKTHFKGLINTGKVNSEFEGNLVRKLGVRNLPAIIVITVSANGDITRTAMPLSRDSRGAVQPPSVQQMREFVGSAIFPTNREGRYEASPWSSTDLAGTAFMGVAPLYDLTAGLGAHTKSNDAAQALRDRIARFQTEHKRYPTTNDPVSNFVHVYVISHLAHPSILLRWLAHRYVRTMRFAHISLPLVSHSGTLLQTLKEAFPGVDLPHSVAEGSFILVQKETSLQQFQLLTSDANMRIEEDHTTIESITALLEPMQYLNIPRLTYNNFYQLCYPQFEAGKSSAEKRHSPNAHRECLVLFVENQAMAHKLALDFFKTHEDGDSSAPSVPKHIQLVWLPRSTQTRFYSFFQNAQNHHYAKLPQTHSARLQRAQLAGVPIYAVLLRAPQSSFTVFPYASLESPTVSKDLLDWVLHVSAQPGSGGSSTATGTSDAPAHLQSIQWIDGRGVGGMPFVAEDNGLLDGSGFRALYSLVSTPFRWVADLFGLGGNVSASSNSSSDSSTLILFLVFTFVFFLSTTGMLRFVAT